MAGSGRREAADAQVLVIGAGPSGLATAACLRRAGVDCVVLERAARVGDQWRAHYDRLHLHTARRLSGLPGLALPRSAGPWVSRDDLAAYLERYVQRQRLDVRLEVEVASVAPAPEGGWAVMTDTGVRQARQVVMATGHNRRPFLPAWPGADAFAGRLRHSSQYRNAQPFRGRDVLVVGTGNSGGEIAVDLTQGGARRVLLSVRTPPNILPRAVLGLPIQVPGVALSLLPTRVGDPTARLVQRAFVPDLRAQGLRRPAVGVATQFAAGGTLPVLDVGLARAVRTGRVTPVAAVSGLRDDGVELADGSVVAVDAVIAATGYRSGLRELLGELDVLDDRELPRAHGTALPQAPGLTFVGYHPTIGGHLREIGREAARAARAIAGPAAQP